MRCRDSRWAFLSCARPYVSSPPDGDDGCDGGRARPPLYATWDGATVHRHFQLSSRMTVTAVTPVTIPGFAWMCG